MTIWEAKDVKFELVQAFRVLAAVPVRDSYYTAGGGFWPSICYDREEVREQQRQATTENIRIGKGTRYSPQQIKRMESVLLGQGERKGWLAEFLEDYPGAKRCLARWAQWEAQGRNIKHECFIRGLAYSTFRRKRDQAAQILADALSQARIELA